MQERPRDPGVGLVAVGFSPAAPLAALADRLGWPGAVLSDEDRLAYARLGLPRAGLLRTYSVGTLLRYGVAAVRGHRLHRPVEDTRQLGGDAVVVDGVAVAVWRPRSPDDRVDPGRLLAEAHARLAARGEGPPRMAP